MILEKGKVHFKQAIRDFWCGYIDFKGFTTRAGYWWAVLFSYLVPVLCVTIATLLGFMGSSSANIALIFLIVALLFGIAIFIPTVTLSIRRWRDAGLSNAGIIILCVLDILFNGLSVQFHTFSNALTLILGIVMLLLSILPTDKLVTHSQYPLWKFLFRSHS